MKNIVIISTSLRENSNSFLLAKSFMDGATANGNKVELISLKDKTISFCKGCLACQNTKRCVINDDANTITDKLCDADIVVWATPVYYYGICGQMKTMIDRANSLYGRDYKFKKVYLLATATEDEPYTVEGAVKGVQGWVDCFDGVTFAGTLFVGGVTDPKDILSDKRLVKAFDLGKSIE